MTIHLIKLCVGIESVRALESVQARRRAVKLAAGEEALNIHITRNRPRRAREILDGGSLYWVIRRQIRVRQHILRLDTVTDEEGRNRCALVLAPDLVRTEQRSFRPFQGWRYLDCADAPADLAAHRLAGHAAGERAEEEMPPDMVRDLRELGLL